MKVSLALKMLLLAPLFTLLIPLTHIGGPFNPNSFVVFSIWSVCLLIGLSKLWGIGEFLIPKWSIYPLFSALAIATLLAIHSQYSDPVAWVPVGLLVFSVASLLVAWNLINKVNSHRLWLDIDTWFTGLVLVLCIATIPGADYLGLVAPFSFGQLIFPLDQGGFLQPNLFASFLSTYVAFSFWIAFINKRGIQGFRGLTLLLSVSVIVMSGSKMGLICVFVICGLWAIFLRVVGQNRNAILPLTFGLLGWAISFFVAEVRLNYSVENIALESATALADLVSGNDASTNIRLSMYKAGLLMGLESLWFGHGVGKFQFLMAEAYTRYPIVEVAAYGKVVGHPHSELIQWWTAGGLFGLAFVVGPIVLMLFKILPVGKHTIGSFAMLFPITFHSIVEFPLYQSGAHWALLALVIVFLASEQQLTSSWSISFSGSVFRSVQLSPFLVLFLATLGISANGAWIGKNIVPNALEFDGVSKVEAYVAFRSDDPELHHWAYKELEGHKWIRNVFQLAMKEGNGQLVSDMLPKMKESMKFLNNKESWSLYGGALAGLGKKAELIGFIDYIEKLDPKYAKGMRQAYGL